MKTSIKDYQNLLKVFAILLEFGAIRTQLVIDWADTILASEEESEYAFIELSTIDKNAQSVIQILLKNCENTSPEITSRAIIGILGNMLKEEKVGLKTAFQITTHLSYEQLLTSEEQYLLYGYWDYLDFKSMDNSETFRHFTIYFNEFLSIYKNFKFENHHQWSTINEQLKPNLSDQLKVIKQNSLY